VRGIKEWLLFGPEHSAKLKPTAKFSPDAICSGVDITQMTSLPVQQLRALERIQGGLFCRCAPGDALYIPAGYWHAALAVTPSMSLSSSCYLPAAGGPCVRLADFARRALHAAGYYRFGTPDGCTCHAADGRPPATHLSPPKKRRAEEEEEQEQEQEQEEYVQQDGDGEGEE
jgi:hypothetical protein